VAAYFEGDTEQEAESSMLNASLIHHADILKVGHLGSKTASSTAFLSAVHPESAIYMAGINNQYGHPAAETIAALTNIGATIFGAYVNRTISVTKDGKRYLTTSTKHP
jgi:beta-lactamase superfamily II metal-dependent hydrolase